MDLKLFKTKFGSALLNEWVDGAVENGLLEPVEHPKDRDYYFVQAGPAMMRLVRIDNLDIDNDIFTYKKDFVLNFPDCMGGWGILERGEWITNRENGLELCKVIFKDDYDPMPSDPYNNKWVTLTYGDYERELHSKTIVGLEWIDDAVPVDIREYVRSHMNFG